MFLVLCASRGRDALSENPDAMEDARPNPELAQNIVEQIELMVGDEQPQELSAPSNSAVQALCQQTGNLFAQMDSLLRSKFAILRDAIGARAITPADLEDCWKKYGNAGDMEAAKAYIAQMHLFGADTLLRIMEPVPEMLKEQSEWFGGLAAQMASLVEDEAQGEVED